MSTVYQLTPDQQVLYDKGGVDYFNLISDIDDELSWQGITEPVALVAADGQAILCGLTGARR